MFNRNLANDWIRTADLWYWKRLLNHLSHNHCSFNILMLFEMSKINETEVKIK